MNTRKFSKKQEKAVAKAMGGKVQANSGATPFHKGDIISSKILFEAKTSVTEKKSFTIQKEVLEKLEEERFAMGRDLSSLVFNFGPDADNYYILTEKGLQSLLKELLLLKGELL